MAKACSKFSFCLIRANNNASFLLAWACFVFLCFAGGCSSGSSSEIKSSTRRNSVQVDSTRDAKSTHFLFLLIDYSASSESYRQSFFEESSVVISQSSCKELGVIAFGQKAYELYFGPLPTKREYIQMVKGWMKQPSANTRGTDLSSPFLQVQDFMNRVEAKSLSVHLYTDAGMELMSKDRIAAFKRIVTNLNARYGLSYVTVSGVRANIDDNYRKGIRSLFENTNVTPEIY